MREIKNFSLEQLKKLDGEILTIEEFEMLEEHSLIVDIENMGFNRYLKYWFDVTLEDETRIDIYTE